ncbi:hypothetical protein MRX96_033712 [Rhipicephalus microplus]
MTKSTNSKFNDENFHRVDFYGVPKIKLRECAKTTELWSRRRAQWLRGIRPEDVDESASYYRVCGAHWPNMNAALFGLKAKRARGAKLGNLDEAVLTRFKQALTTGINFKAAFYARRQRKKPTD